MMQLTDGERIARDLCEAESPIDNIIEVDPTDVARRIDESFAELRAKLAAAQEESKRHKAMFDAINADFSKLEDQLAKAEQRVAEWQPIETAPKDGTRILGWCAEFGARETKMNFYGEGSIGHANWKSGKGPRESGWDWTEPKNGWGLNWNPTHWMPLPTPPKRSMEG